MKVKNIFKSYRRKQDIPNLKEDIKDALGIHSKKPKGFVLSRFKLQFGVLAVIMIFTLMIASLGNEDVIDDNNGPIVDNDLDNSNNGGGTSRLLSRRIEEMKSDSYTMTIYVQDKAIYAYKMEEKRIEIHYFFDGTDEKLTFFIDLNKTPFPYLYSNYDGINWIQTLEDMAVLDQGYLFAMNWLDPSVIEDDWFEFDETKQTYSLKEIFKDSLFENSNLPVRNFEDVHITMEEDVLSITIKGEGYYEIYNYSNRYAIVYSNIGSTEVNFPIGAINTTEDMIDSVFGSLEVYENNYHYTFILTDVDNNMQTDRLYYGARFNDTHIKKKDTEDTYYLSKTEDAYVEVVFENYTYTKSILTEEVYQEALKEHVMINISNISKAWFDQETMVLRPYIGVSYRILDEYYDSLIQIKLDGDITINDAYIGFMQQYTGFSLNISIAFEIDLRPYIITYTIHGINQVAEFEEPKTLGPELFLSTMVEEALNSKQYEIYQYMTVEENRQWILRLVRDDFTYLYTESKIESTYQTFMYGFEDNTYQVIRIVENNPYDAEVIDEQTYIDDLKRVLWIDLSKVLDVLIENDVKDDMLFNMREEAYEKIVSETILEQYSFISASITKHVRLAFDSFFTVTLTLLSKDTNQVTTLEIEYVDVGKVTLEFIE
jgi:hypothetical protein